MAYTFEQLARDTSVPAGAVSAFVFADASYSIQTWCGGWAGWLGMPGRTAAYAGALGLTVGSSTEAEMSAISHTLRSAGEHLTPGLAVMIQSDCAPVLGWILAGYSAAMDWAVPDAPVMARPRFSDAMKTSPALAAFCKTARDLALVVFTRHVRGHRPGMGIAHGINANCDRRAKDQRQAMERSRTL